MLNYHPCTKYDGRYCFHRCLSVNISGGGTLSRSGGVPHLRSGVGMYPIQVWMVGGTPSQRWRYPSQVWMVGGYSILGEVSWPGLDGLVPHLRSGGVPVQVWMLGVPHPRSGVGWYPSQVWMMGVPHLGGPQPGKAGAGVPPTLGWGTSPDLGWGTLTIKTWPGYPAPWYGVPPPHHQDRTGVPPTLDLGWGSPPPRQSSIASTCYFLVWFLFSHSKICDANIAIIANSVSMTKFD